MTHSDENMWYPKLPDGYTGQPRHAHPQQHAQPGWHAPPNQQNNHWQPGWQHHGYPPHGQQPAYPGYPPHFHHHGHHGHDPNSHHSNDSPQQNAPTSAPPNRIPDYPDTQLRAVDPGGIAGCLYRYTYVWTSRRNGFWYYPTFVGRTSIAGYRWDPRYYRWEYYGLDLKKIDSFQCT